MNGTKYEMLCDVRADQRDKRQQLTRDIDLGLCAGGARITAGVYEVVIRRLTKKEIEKMKAEEAAEKDKDSST